MLSADVSKWIKIRDENDISKLEERNIIDPNNENYILNDENNGEIIDIFERKNGEGYPKSSLNINSELKKNLKMEFHMIFM